MSNLLKILDYFFLTRPILFIPGWATFLAGYAAAKGDVNFSYFFAEKNFNVEWWNPHVFSGLFIFSCAMGGSFILNQLQDIHSDKRNNKLFLLGEGFISPHAGYIESIVLLGFALLGAFFLNAAFFLSIFAFNVITGYLYNFAPFSFKNKPIGGLAANMAMGWLAFCMGWVIDKPISFELLLFSLPYLFFNTALYFLTTLPDLDGDRASGKRTFPVQYGAIITVVLSLFFFILAIGTGIRHKNEFMLVVSILTAPFMIRLAIRRDTRSAIFAVKSGIASFALLICARFPAFLLLLAMLFFFTRFYYKNRFDFDYPNFRGQ